MKAIATGFSPVEDLLRHAVAAHDPILVADGHEVRLARVHESARSVAARLVADGIEPGDLVFVMMRNSAEWLAVALGTWFAGAVLVPINTRFTTREVASLLRAAPPRAWICDDDLAPLMKEAEGQAGVDARYTIATDVEAPLKDVLEWGRAPGDGPVVRIDPDAPAAVFFTAGTSGEPKGALTSHAAIAAFADVVEKSTYMSASDTVVVPMPMFYTGGIKASLANLLIGARVVTFRSWSTADLTEAIDEFDATFLWAVGSVWALMMRSSAFDAARVQTLRAVWRTGSYTPRQLLDDLLETFPGRPHYHSYGLTECNLACMENDALRYEHSCGFPTHGVELTIDGSRAPEQVGEIMLRGRQQFSGYLGKPELTASALQDGWVRTGDQGWLEPDGRLHVLGRGSDIIIRGGENISAAEVERVLLEQPDVFEAAVVGIADDIFGHELKAIVVPQKGATLDSEGLREECRALLAEYKVPKFVEIRSEPLPRSPSGKIVKSEL